MTTAAEAAGEVPYFDIESPGFAIKSAQVLLRSIEDGLAACTDPGEPYGDMLAALRSGAVDAVVDDDVVFVPLAGSAEFDLAFTVRTGNRWGLAVAKSNQALLSALDDVLAAVKADGRLRQAWRDWLPSLEYPFTTSSPPATD